MAIKELNLDFDTTTNKMVEIVGRRDVLSKSVEGNWATTFKGRGMEFTGYRAYTFSDDASLIDWKASLRSKELLVREFEEFKNFKIFFLLDVSNSMLFTSTDKLKVEFGAELVHSLAESASHTGDAIGLGMFSEKIVASLHPGFGKGMKSEFERLLTNKENYGGPRDLKKSLLQLNSILGDPTIIVIVSDFLGFPDNWEHYLSLLAMHHQVIGIMLKDERDRTLPTQGQFVLKDPHSDQTVYVGAKDFAKEYKEISKNHEEYVFNVFRKLKSDCQLVVNGSDFGQTLQKFFNSQQHILR